MDFLQLMQERYTTKYYDANKVVPQEIIDKIIKCTLLTPTSVNSQPYHLYVASGEAKQRLRPAVLDFNLQRFDGASHVVVFSSQTKISDEHLAQVLAAEERDGRLNGPEIRFECENFRRIAAQSHVDLGDYESWCGKQAYIAFATMLYAAKAYGVDSTPVEGIDKAQMDSILGLSDKSETSQFMVFLGYRADNDSNTLDKRPKSRLSAAEMVTVL